MPRCNRDGRKTLVRLLKNGLPTALAAVRKQKPVYRDCCRRAPVSPYTHVTLPLLQARRGVYAVTAQIGEGGMDQSAVGILGFCS